MLGRILVLMIFVFPNGLAGQKKIVVGPPYAVDPLLTDLGNPKGKRFEFAMPLAKSEFFRGYDKTLDSQKPARINRRIFVYIPAAYENGSKAPVLVTLDGPGHFNEISRALDNLASKGQADRKMPAFILVSVENVGGNAKGSERGLEYDTMSDRFARFINFEVLPAVLNNKEIRAAYPEFAFTTDPWGKAVMGCSSGASAAFAMGWFRPDLFRRTICYSGTFVDQQDDDAPEERIYPLGAWEYHSGMKLIENTAKKPLRIFMHVSENDLGRDAPAQTHRNWVLANERMAMALQTTGYDVKYVYSLDSGHCDAKVFDHTLADTLLWIWRDYE